MRSATRLLASMLLLYGPTQLAAQDSPADTLRVGQRVRVTHCASDRCRTAVGPLLAATPDAWTIGRDAGTPSRSLWHPSRVLLPGYCLSTFGLHIGVNNLPEPLVRLVAFLAALALASPPSLRSQPSQVTPGQRLRVTAPELGLKKVPGVLESFDTHSVSLLVADTSISVPLSSLGRVELHMGRQSHVLGGVGIGMLAGAVLGALLGPPLSECPSDGCSGAAVTGAVVFGGTGALVGGLIGGFSRTDRWEEVELGVQLGMPGADSLRIAADSSRATQTLAIRRSRQSVSPQQRRAGRGALIGASVGLAAGIALGASSDGIENWTTAMGGVTLGTVVGLGIGAVVRREPAERAPPNEVRFRITSGRRGGFALSVSLGF